MKNPTDSQILHFNKRTIILTFVALLSLALLFGGFSIFSNYQQSQLLSENPILASESEIKELKEKVGKLIELPQEEPIITTVVDKSKIAHQAFIGKSETGDKILTLNIAKKAILYRPSTNKIIEVASLSSEAPVPMQPQPSQASPTPQPSPSLKASVRNYKITILNGTRTKGLASTTKEKIQKEYPELTNFTTGNTKGDYKTSIVVYLKSDSKDFAKELSLLLNASSTSTLPEGELSSSSDIVVIVGE